MNPYIFMGLLLVVAFIGMWVLIKDEIQWKKIKHRRSDVIDCRIFYKNGKLLLWNKIPTWYVQFLASSPPDKETEDEAKKELKRRM